ncbi:MAG: hypothetical protein J6D23_06335 [Clostridia bacterium]|nr:hypothetical protein [Clostridia bacterium]
MKIIDAESKSNGFVNEELFGKTGNQSNNHNRSSNGREFGKELPIDNGKPQNNQTGIFEDNGNRGRGVNSTE